MAFREKGPGDVLYREASNRLLDYLGVTIAAWNEPETASLRRFAERLPVREKSCSDQASVILSTIRTFPPHAAFLNGTMGHVKELDDEHHGMIGHPGVVIVPTCLSVGESEGASGRELLSAIVVGYEVGCRVGMAFRPGVLHECGFHPTGVCGSFGALPQQAI